MNPSSVMRGGDADRRRLKLRQADYRRQEPLPIPDFSHLEPLVPGIANQPPSWKEVTSVISKFKGRSLNPSLIKVNEKSAHTTLSSFLYERGIDIRRASLRRIQPLFTAPGSRVILPGEP